MIDIACLRRGGDAVRELLLAKEPSFPVDKLIELEAHVRLSRHHIEEARQEKNSLAKKGAGAISDNVRARSIELGRHIKEAEQKLVESEKEFSLLWQSCPNIPMADLPHGGKEANKVVRAAQSMPLFDFTPKNHLELNEKLGWFDFEDAAATSGSGFVVYRGDGARVMYALTRLMMRNNASHGFEPVMVPYLVSSKSMMHSGNLPKFAEDAYHVAADDMYLIPTAEVPLTNLSAKKIYAASDLPLRSTSWSSCFRREAGGYGSQERGLIRIHQFEKVELYTVCVPEDSEKEHERMLECGASFLKMLNLPYQVSLLAMQDCSFSSAKTYDIEVYLPGQDRFYEVSSASMCTDFQARRAGIRYRSKPDVKPSLAHTLNASSLALPRLLVALMEHNQQADGSIKLPDILQKEMDALW